MTKILVGTTTIRKYAFVLDKFFENQKKIQDNFSQSELVIATDELKFLGYLKHYFEKYKVKGEAIYYETKKPDYAKDRNWSMSGGREAVRQYALRNNFDYLLVVDTDMVYDNSVIEVLLANSNGYDIVQSGYKLGLVDNIGFSGCNLIRSSLLKKIRFRCVEFKNGFLVEEGNMFEYDSFRKGAKIRKGVFVGIEHYLYTGEKLVIIPQRLTLQKRFIVLPIIRYLIVGFSLCLRRDLGLLLQKLFTEKKNV